MGTLKVNGDISATGTISASSFLGNASSATYTHQWRTTAENPCTTSTDSNTGIFNVPDSRVYWISKTGTVIDQLNQWGYILDIGNNAERHQIWMTQSSGDMAHRGGNSNGWSGSWRILLDSINYTSYTVTKTGSGASGTWGINVTGSAGSVAWGNVTGKPSSFTPSSHTHDYLPLAGGGTLTGSAVINFPAGSVSVAASTPMSLSYGRLACYGTLCINANTDNSGTEYVILTAGKGLSSSTADGLAIGTSTLTWQGSTVLTTGNIGSQSVNYASSAGNADTIDGHHFHWSGQGGQPTWLWGANEHGNSYVWNPANFSVNYANRADGANYADRVYPINSNPNNSHPGYGLKVFYSWDQGQVGNDNGGYANGITIGSHPSDQAYGFQIVQNMWNDRTYTRRYNQGWQSWKTLAWTDDLAAYLPLSGGTMTGNIIIGSNYITGETGSAQAKCHGLQIGYPSHDYWTFSEWGGLYHFYKYQTSGSTVTVNTLCGSINEYGWVQGPGGYGSTFPSSPAVGQVFYKT